MDGLIKDFRFALRLLRKSPWFTGVAVLTLALGIGATIAIFSVVYGIVFRPLPYDHPERLVAVWTTDMSVGGGHQPASMPDFKDWQFQNSTFDALSAYAFNRYDLLDEQGGRNIRAAMVSPEFFRMLGIRPLLGRPLERDDERERVAVLSYQLWQQVFNGDRTVIGKTLRLREHDFEVVGVMPPSFHLPRPDVSLWLSLAEIYATSNKPSGGNSLTNRSLHGFGVIGLLRQGITLHKAQAELNAIEARLGQSFPKEDKAIRVELVPLRAQVVGEVEHALVLFLGAVTFVLLIACANVANLLLARATVRKREMAVRQALGASPSRLIRQVLTESALLGIIGSAFGMLLAFCAVRAFLQIAPHTIPRLEDIHMDGTVILFVSGVCVAATIIFGVAPAFRTRDIRLNDDLRESGRGTGAEAQNRLRDVLASFEIAAATVLVVGAALTLQSFVHLALLHPGFSPDHLLTAEVVASPDRYSQPYQLTRFFNDILARIRALPGVQSAGGCTSMPPDISQDADVFTVEGSRRLDGSRSPYAWYLPATPGFLRSLGLPLLAGRDFDDADNADASPVAIVNDQIVKKYFGQESPLGQSVNFKGVHRTIIGVVGDTTYNSLGSPADFQIYVPFAQGTFSALHFAIRTAGEPLNLVQPLRSAVRDVDREARATRISTMRESLSRSILEPRFEAALLSAFGLVGLVLAGVGTFGVISYAVSQRTHELGVRLALGAKHKDVIGLVVGHSLRLALTGVASGVAAALALSRFLSSLLYGVTATDPKTLVLVSVLLVSVALVGCYFPLRRALRVDPIITLRCE